MFIWYVFHLLPSGTYDHLIEYSSIIEGENNNYCIVDSDESRNCAGPQFNNGISSV